MAKLDTLGNCIQNLDCVVCVSHVAQYSFMDYTNLSNNNLYSSIHQRHP